MPGALRRGHERVCASWRSGTAPLPPAAAALPPMRPLPPPTQAYKDEGGRHFSAGDYDSAAACYTEALRVAPAAAERRS